MNTVLISEQQKFLEDMQEKISTKIGIGKYFFRIELNPISNTYQLFLRFLNKSFKDEARDFLNSENAPIRVNSTEEEDCVVVDIDQEKYTTKQQSA